MTKYLDGEQRREIEEAKRQGIPEPRIAERLHMEVEELCRLMGWPQWQDGPVKAVADAGFDLWSTDRLDGQL
jgi:hypothetical protein